MKNDVLLTLYRRPETVFTFGELSLIFSEIPVDNLKSRLSYFVSAGKLVKPRRGIFAKAGFDFWELANKIFRPSYISLETVLEENGVIFQRHEAVTAVSYLTRRIKIAGGEISYRKIKDEVLTHDFGIERIRNSFVASRERAFLDAVFLYRDYHFDNLDVLDWEKIFDWQDFYRNASLVKRVNSYFELKEENA